MAIINHLIGKGVPTGVAAAICGGSGELGTIIQAGTGTAQNTSTLIASGSVYVSIASASGRAVQLPLCDPNSSVELFNGSGNAINLYGQTGEGIQGGSANAKFTVVNNKSCTFKKYTSTVWGANLSA